MKNIKNIVLTICFLLLPIKAYAFSGSVNVTCSPNQIKPNNTSTCTISATVDSPISSIDMPYTITGNGSITSYTFDNNIWSENGHEGNKIEAYAKITESNPTGDLTGTFNIGTFVIKAASAATSGNTIKLDFQNMKFGYEETSSTNSYDIPNTSAIITVIEDVAKGLKSLTCANCKAQPQLETNQYDYLIELSSVDTNNFSLNATANNANDTIVYTDADTNENLTPSNIAFKTSGGNTGMLVKITVGTGDNQTVYYVAVTKPVQLVGELSSLTVGGINIVLSSDRDEYEVSLDDVSNYRISATVKDSSKFTIEDTASILTKNLSGENTYSLYVKPIDTSSGYTGSTYKITVKKNGSSTHLNDNPQPAEPSSNPKTGEGSAIVMGIVLIISFAISIYYYKRNIKEFNN